jgi:biotin transport system ATP-binding protein
MTGPVLEVNGVTHVYGDGPGARTVLTDVTVRLEERRVGVIGANGSGKSTFARLLNGLVVPTAGTVRVHGLDTRTDPRAVRRQVGFCFTNPDAQIVMPTVREDVAFSLRRKGLSRQDVDRRVEDTLSRYGLAGHADHPAHLLSGGQKQLLALAAVLVTEPSVLVLDEPTTLLDLRNAQHVGRLLGGLDQQVVLVTHDLELLHGFDRVLVFEEGQVVCDGAPEKAVPFYRRLMQGPLPDSARSGQVAGGTR